MAVKNVAFFSLTIALAHCFCLSSNNSTACTYRETLKPFVTHTYKGLFGMHIDLMFLELACMYWCEATISSMHNDAFSQNIIHKQLSNCVYIPIQ